MREKFELKDGDVGFLRIKSGKVARTLEPADNILVDVDQFGSPLSVEVVSISSFTDQEIWDALRPLFATTAFATFSPNTETFATFSSNTEAQVLAQYSRTPHSRGAVLGLVNAGR